MRDMGGKDGRIGEKKWREKMEEMGNIDEHGITGDKLAWSHGH